VEKVLDQSGKIKNLKLKMSLFWILKEIMVTFLNWLSMFFGVL
jgi:hypothetical protein